MSLPRPGSGEGAGVSAGGPKGLITSCETSLKSLIYLKNACEFYICSHTPTMLIFK